MPCLACLYRKINYNYRVFYLFCNAVLIEHTPQIRECSSDDELRQLLGSEDYNFRYDAGVCMPSTAVSLKQKEDIALALAKHYLLYSTMAELEQLKQGVKELGILNLLHAQLSPSTVINMFKVIRSPVGSNQRDKEEAVILGWTEYIHGMAWPWPWP